MLHPVFPRDPCWGPSLFLFHVNDIVSDIGSEIRLFADDVIMYSSIKRATDIIQFRNDIERLKNQAERWMMKFNVDKCCVMFIGRDRMEFSGQVNYFLNKRAIEEVTELRYLGVTLNKNLKWEGHIHGIINIAMRILGLLKSTLYHADIKTKLIAYKTLCRPLWVLIGSMGSIPKKEH